MSKISKEWVYKMIDGFDKSLGEIRRKEIMDEAENLNDDSSDEEILTWVENFIDKISLPGNEGTAKELLTTNCPCNIYEEPDFISRVKDFYNKSNSIEDFINRMHSEGFWNLVLKDNIIYTTKPFVCDCGYKHPFEGAYSTKCHCGLSARVKKPVSKVFCYCGSGFYKPLFDELWQADTVIEPVDTVIAGDDKCVFAIHVPDKLKISSK